MQRLIVAVRRELEFYNQRQYLLHIHQKLTKMTLPQLTTCIRMLRFLSWSQFLSFLKRRDAKRILVFEEGASLRHYGEDKLGIGEGSVGEDKLGVAEGSVGKSKGGVSEESVGEGDAGVADGSVGAGDGDWIKFLAL